MDVFSALDGVYDLDAPPGEAEAPERAAQAQQAQQQRYAQRLSETTRLDVASITAVRHFGPSPDVLALLHQECDAERECEARGSMLRFVKVFWKQASERFEKQLKARKAAAKKAAKDAAALEKKGRVEKRDAEKRDAKDRKKGKPLALAPDSTTATEAAKPLTAEDKAKAKTVAAAAEAAKKAAQVWAKAAEAEAKAKEKAAAALRDQATSIIRQNMAVDAQAETRSAHEAAKDALERLGAIREQAGNAIRKHHRRRALEVHPDRGGHREAYNLFIQASTILKADSHRARYLKELSQAMGVMQHNFGVAASQANMHSFHEAWIHNNDNVGLFTDAGEEEKKLLEFARRKQRAEKRAEAFMIKADASLSTPAQVLFFATLSDEKVPSLAAPCHTIPVQLRIAEDSDIIAVEVSCDCVAVARKSAVGDMLKGGAISKSFGRAEMDYDRGCFAVRVAHDGGSASGDAFSEGTWAVKWRVSVAREASQHALWSSWSTPADVQVVDRAVEGRDRLREQLRAECDAGAAALSRVVRAATRLGMRVEKKELMHALQFCRKSAEKLQAHKLDGAAADVAAAAAKAVSTARKAVSSAAPALEALEKRDAAEKSRQQRASFLAVLAHKRDAGTMEKWVQKVKDADLAALAGDANRLFQCLCEDKWPARVLAAAAARNDLFSHRNLKKLRDLADLAQTLLDKEAEKAARESKRQAALLANFTARDWQAEETARRKTCDALAVAAAKAREAEAEKLRIAEALRLAVPDAAALAAAPAFYETAQAAARRGEMMLKDEALARELHQLELMEEQMDPSRHFRLTDDGENADAPEDEYDITCPIRRTLFLDPVVLQGDGQAYEREAIEKWLLAHRTSPYSGARLPPGGERLTPNPALQRKADAARRRAQPPRNAQPPPGRDAQLWQWQQQTEERQQAAEAQQRLARHEDQRRRERQQEVRQPWPQQWQPTPAPRPRAAAPAPARPPPQRAPSAAPRPAAAPRQASPLASELEQFLGTLDLEQESLAGLRLSLVENEIFDSQTLAFLSDEDMKEIGIKLGTKKKIIRHLPAWRAQA